MKQLCSKKFSSAAAAVQEAQSDVQWQLHSAVCLQRHAVIIAKKNDIEERFSQLMSAMEDELSLLSDHELRHKKDL